MLFESAVSAFIFQINIMDTLPAGSGSAAPPPHPAWLISLTQPHRTHKNTKATPVWALTADTKCKKATHFRVGGRARVARLPSLFSSCSIPCIPCLLLLLPTAVAALSLIRHFAACNLVPLLLLLLSLSCQVSQQQQQQRQHDKRVCNAGVA